MYEMVTSPDETVPFPSDPIPTEVVEVTEVVGIPERLDTIDSHLLGLGEANNLIAGILVFFVVTTLCYFAYKFFRIFF